MNSLETNKKTSIALVAAIVIFASIIGLWAVTLTPLNNHECLVTVTARQMLADGDWIIPKYKGQPRLEKTPLMYWLVASTAMLTGQIDELSSRIPSIALAVLTAIAILYFVNQWLDFKTALLAAAVWASTLAFVKYSQSARPEMALCSFVSIAMMAFYEGLRVESKRRSIIFMLIFWISFSLGMLAKGPAPLVLVGPPLFCYFLFFKQWKKFPKTMPIIGTIIFLAAIAPWPIMVAAKIPEGWAFWKIEFIDRFMGEHVSGDKPIWYYGIVIFSFAAPLSAFVPHAIMSPFYSVWGRKRQIMWYLWLWMVVQIIVMTISGGKRQHYILSAVPGFSILAGIVLKDMIFDRIAFKAKEARRMFTGHFIAAIAAAIVCIYWVTTKKPQFLYPAIHTSLVVVTAFALSAILFYKNKKGLATIALFAGYCATMMVVQIYFIAPTSYNNGSREFSKRIGQTVPAEDNLVAFQYISARTLQYAGRNIEQITDIEKTYQLYEDGAWIIACGEYYDDLKTDGRFEVHFEQENAERRGSIDVTGVLIRKP